MYKALDVAMFIVQYCNDDEHWLYCSNPKLQKLLYFVQANFLFNSNGKRRCFCEPIIALDWGPVVYEAYDAFKANASCHILKNKDGVLLYDDEDLWNSTFARYEDVYIKEDDQELIIETIEHFKNWSPTTMNELIFKQAPWKEAYNSGKDAEITCEALYNYFKDE